ncbi:MAG: DUF2029 domain-containing protein [Chloroflexi bacterium]|nr:DUF2029 domain-containing protein [Chloroflexota bacterium]
MPWDRFALIGLAAALALRIAVVLLYFGDVPPAEVSADAGYYLLVAEEPWRLGLPGITNQTELAEQAYVQSVGPVYPALLAILVPVSEALAPQSPFVIVRLFHALIDVGIVAAVYAITAMLFGQTAGRIALVMQVLDPRFVIQVGVVQTELVFILLVLGTFGVYLHAERPRGFLLAGLLLGLAILTRAVALLFPLVMAAHAWFHPRRREEQLRGVLRMAAVAVLVMLPWMVRTTMLTGEIIPVADSGLAHLWLSSLEDGREASPNYQVERIEEGIFAEDGTTSSSGYLTSALRNILSEPLAFAGRTVRDTVIAYAQPYGAFYVREPGSESTWAVFRGVLDGERTLEELASQPAFVPRLVMYGWHYAVLLTGAAGMVLARRNWSAFLFVLWALYGTGLTAALLVEPRYLFPYMVSFTVFAALLLSELAQQQQEHGDGQSAEQRGPEHHQRRQFRLPVVFGGEHVRVDRGRQAGGQQQRFGDLTPDAEQEHQPH